MSSSQLRQRLFFALQPDDAVREYLVERQHQLAKAGIAGRRVVAENIHLTLVFLGSISPEQRQLAEAAASEIQLPEFSFQLDNLGYWRRPRVVWAGCQRPEAGLFDLVYGLRRGLVARQLPSEDRPYVPHITLMRKVNQRHLQLPDCPAIEWRASEFCLMQSISEKSGVRYQIEAKWMLQWPDSAV